jgi:LacI family transcriptional regulator
VAAAANVSVATVSNVINGVRSSASSATRKTVLRAIGQLGYRPQIIGRGLRTARRYSVAVLVIDESEDYLKDPFVGAVVAGLTKALNRSGYSAVLHGCRHDQFAEAAIVRQISVDAYCVVMAGSVEQRRRLLRRLAALQQPIVLIQDDLKSSASGFCAVRQDDYSGGRLLAEHLLARRSGKFVFVLPELEWSALNARVKGVRAALAASGSRSTLELLRTSTEHFPETTVEIETYLRDSGLPAAILGANDQMAIAALRALERLGARVPRDVSVTGFNALEFWQYSKPLLTTIASPAAELGATAARSVLARIESGVFSSREIVLPVHLRIGDST